MTVTYFRRNVLQQCSPATSHCLITLTVEMSALWASSVYTSVTDPESELLGSAATCPVPKTAEIECYWNNTEPFKLQICLINLFHVSASRWCADPSGNSHAHILTVWPLVHVNFYWLWYHDWTKLLQNIFN